MLSFERLVKAKRSDASCISEIWACRKSCLLVRAKAVQFQYVIWGKSESGGRFAITGQRLTAHVHAIANTIEAVLEKERDQLPLWTPVGVGLGIVIWQIWGSGIAISMFLLFGAFFLCGLFIGRGRRLSGIVLFAALTIATGFAAIAIKSAVVAAPVLEKIRIEQFYGRINRVEDLSARDIIRLELQTDGHADLPAKVRINLSPEQYKPSFVPGAVILLRARLMPPAGPALPGGYDFARRAWFSGIGATGSALGELELYKPSASKPLLSSMRTSLSEHIHSRMTPASGPIGAALITGGQGTIAEEDAQAMRNSGMAHLLSISGLHVTAVVGATFLLVSRLLALFGWLALRISVPLIAAGSAAAVAVAYTLLTGAEVPTVRSCVAALMILVALSMGRDALSLRLLAFGALFILLFWPEALAGPSFQLSFAAVTTIVVLHDLPWMQRITDTTESSLIAKLARGFVSLLLTGFAIELVLAPIALFHFHKTGVYGALANMVAIPLTTFVIMPAEALALLFDIVGIGAPFWWVAGQGVEIILWIAHRVNGLPGSVSMLPSMPIWAYAAMVTGGLWFALFRTRMRYAGAIPFIIGAIAMISAPRPDILVTGDGKHLAITTPSGEFALLRDRAGDYVRSALAENAGIQSEAVAIENWPGVECSPDICIISIKRGERIWRILATRTRYMVPSMEMAAACKRVDIVISDRWLPYSCKPRWLKADRGKLAETGGLAFYLGEGRIESVNADMKHVPWYRAPTPRPKLVKPIEH
jgi:competence protein ComEC